MVLFRGGREEGEKVEGNPEKQERWRRTETAPTLTFHHSTILFPVRSSLFPLFLFWCFVFLSV